MLVALPGAAGWAAGPNLITNGGFEGSGAGSLSGWAASGGTLTLVAGNGGGHAARVTAGSGVSQTYAYTSSKPVRSTTAGTAYTLAGVVRSAVPGQTVCLRLKELPASGSATVGTAQQCVTTTTAWQAFPVVAYTAHGSGDSLTVNLVQSAPAAGAAFDIDDLSLTVAAGGDATPPSVPGGVAAGADSATAATVTWNPSTDDVGVTGYDVFRDGARVHTVDGSTTRWQDTGLAAGSTYTYTVDAFDAAGNTSAPSGPAQVTTPSGGPSGGPCGSVAATSPRPAYAHVVVIMEENLGYGGWAGSTQAPYTNQLAGECALATNAVGATHPSQLNYVALTSGQLQTWSGSARATGADNLFHQLNAAGLGWRALEEGMQSPCSQSTSFPYKTGHNPPVWFTDLRAGTGDGSCPANDVGFSTAAFDPSALRAFTWITPNICNDFHWDTGCPGTKSGRIQSGDAWLKQVLPPIFASADYQAGRTLVLLTWDEGNESGTNSIDCTAVADIDGTGCHIAIIAMSAGITPGTRDGTRYSHYSVLAALERMWGLPLLDRAATATPLGAAMGF